MMQKAINTIIVARHLIHKLQRPALTESRKYETQTEQSTLFAYKLYKF